MPVGDNRHPVAVVIESGQIVFDRNGLTLLPALAHLHESGVHRDPVNPGRQAGIALERLDALEDAEEGVLKNVLGVVVVARQAAGEAVDLDLVAAEDLLERPRVSGLETRHDVRIRSPRPPHHLPERGRIRVAEPLRAVAFDFHASRVSCYWLGWGKLKKGFASAIGTYAGPEIPHDPDRDLFGEIERAALGQDPQGLPRRVVNHPAGAADGEVGLEGGADVRRHLVIQISRESRHDLFAPIHRRSPRAGSRNTETAPRAASGARAKGGSSRWPASAPGPGRPPRWTPARCPAT